jgi:hypothetical protein
VARRRGGLRAQSSSFRLDYFSINAEPVIHACHKRNACWRSAAAFPIRRTADDTAKQRTTGRACHGCSEPFIRAVTSEVAEERARRGASRAAHGLIVETATGSTAPMDNHDIVISVILVLLAPAMCRGPGGRIRRTGRGDRRCGYDDGYSNKCCA